MLQKLSPLDIIVMKKNVGPSLTFNDGTYTGLTGLVGYCSCGRFIALKGGFYFFGGLCYGQPSKTRTS